MVVDSTRAPSGATTFTTNADTAAALAWLESWTTNGGSVLLCNDGSAQYSYPADSGAELRESGLGEQADRQDLCWKDGHWHGTMKTLADMLRINPAISEAIKAHMAANGLRIIPSTREQGK